MKQLILFFFIITSFISCRETDDIVIKEFCYELTKEVYDRAKVKNIPVKSYIYINEEENYKDYHVYKLNEELLLKKDFFSYSYYYKQNHIYVFVNKLGGEKKIISQKICDDLFLFESESILFDPVYYILIINPNNNKSVVLNDEQRYLSTKELIQKSKGLIDALK
jgi:hypothetical protein